LLPPAAVVVAAAPPKPVRTAVPVALALLAEPEPVGPMVEVMVELFKRGGL